MACTAYERKMAERSPGSWQWASRELWEHKAQDGGGI